MTTTTNEKTIFTIYNNHSPNCGEPPRLDNADRHKYYGYFQNEHGEQWLFIYDYETQTGILRGGDNEWGNVCEVVNGYAGNLILNAEERQWLTACWRAATMFKKPKGDAGRGSVAGISDWLISRLTK